MGERVLRRAWEGVLFVGIVLTVAFGAFEGSFTQNIRTTVIDGLAPVLEVMHRPVVTTREAINDIQGLWYAHDENTTLRGQVAQVGTLRQRVLELEAENQALRNLMSYRPPGMYRFTSARVVADASGAFAQSLLISLQDAGDISLGQAVLGNDGFIGRVISLGRHTGRVLLVTDINSQIPVKIRRTGHRALLVGDNSRRLKLLYLPADLTLYPGDQIVTSGHGGRLPPSLPVGVITGRAGEIAYAVPTQDLSRIEYVRIAQFHLYAGSQGGLPISFEAR